MKKIFALILTALVCISALTACSININLTPPTEAPAAEAPAETAAPAPTEAPATKAPVPTDPPVGTLGDYVKTAQEKTVSFGDGNANTLRIPEITLDSAPAKAANTEITERFGSAFGSENTTGAYAIDYEAYLNGTILSVVVTASYDGGNSYGLCYNFDVTTGDALDSAALCKAIGEDYDAVLTDLYDELKDSYEEKWSALPGNDTEKAKTFADDNLKAAKLYLDGDGDLMAMADTYAAVGGGHWIVRLDL